ncbi:Putative ribosomal protein VAR1 [Septoria linicola]|uniref:Small ribosomal subunit protein uS3m n=1 Tax=Septoria linicola TaxID=215465 RepID=A0A9Q9ARS7_9PEZI|nr:putative ribosomal protein VAR1 [Septoria linicola]USW54577.1 Putative ribosomal protein VAR1 [Septoria linicola]
MPPRSIAVPRGTFTCHAKHLRAQRRSASTAVSHLPTAASDPEQPLWRSRTEPMTRLGQSITGAMEWQTSTYTFNKQAVKPIPVVNTNVEKLIQNYMTMKRVNNAGKDVRAIRTALAARRKSAEKVYVSKPIVKDYGDRVEVKCFIWDGREALKEEKEKEKRGRTQGAEGSGRRQANDSDAILDPRQKVGLQSLIARMYGKQVDLQLTKIKRPHLDADILAAYVAQRLRDRRFTPRRVIRDATWRAPLPSAQAVANINNAKLRAMPQKFSWQDFTLGNAAQASATGIVESLSLSQVSSIQIEAAGRLTKRLTANRSAKKMARRGTASKGPAYMLRGFRKAHTHYAFASGKRRVGQFGIKVSVGHT